MDIKAVLEKKKKANENNSPFPKNSKTTPGNNTQRQMPMRKTGRGK